MADCKYTKKGISGLPDDKPVVYEIQTEAGRPNYVGCAERGRVHERLEEHLPTIPGAKVTVRQCQTIDEARDKEAKLIASKQPKYNKRGK